jgi:hypothetical protein
MSCCKGFADEEIYSLACHFFDETEIKVVISIQCQVAVNHVVQLTEEENVQALQDAIRKYQEEELLKIINRNKPKVESKDDTQ